MDEGRQAITDELVKHGNVLTPEEGNQGPWVQLLVCLRAGLFGRVYTVEEIGLLVRRPMEPAPEAIARVDEAINWRIKRFVDQRIASQRVELYARLAAAMKRRLVA